MSLNKPKLGPIPCFCETAYLGKWTYDINGRRGYFCPLCSGFMTHKRFIEKIFPQPGETGFRPAPLYIPRYQAFVRRGIQNLQKVLGLYQAE